MKDADQDARFAELALAIGALTERVTALEESNAAPKRGPKAERAMTDVDAYRVKFGDHKTMNHKEAAEDLGLSYGQVFSCRGGYTFKHVREDGKRGPDGLELPKVPPEGAAK